MRSFNILFFIAFLFFAQLGFAQNTFKIGPSALINVGFFNEEVSVPLGVEIGYEFGLNDHLSVNLAGTYHQNKHESRFLENRVNEIEQEDFYIGSQLDVRYHFNKRFEGAYIGIGTDVKHYNAKYYFVPTPTDPVPTFVNTEFNVGFSWGTYIPMKKGYLNPNIYLGGNPSDQNEYELHTKVGLNYVF